MSESSPLVFQATVFGSYYCEFYDDVENLYQYFPFSVQCTHTG